MNKRVFQARLARVEAQVENGIMEPSEIQWLLSGLKIFLNLLFCPKCESRLYLVDDPLNPPVLCCSICESGLVRFLEAR